MKGNAMGDIQYEQVEIDCIPEKYENTIKSTYSKIWEMFNEFLSSDAEVFKLKSNDDGNEIETLTNQEKLKFINRLRNAVKQDKEYKRIKIVQRDGVPFLIKK